VVFLFLLSLSDFPPFFFQPGFGAIGAPHPPHTQNAIAHQQGRFFADYIRGQTGDLDGVSFFLVGITTSGGGVIWQRKSECGLFLENRNSLC